jgi:hypothetical protein
MHESTKDYLVFTVAHGCANIAWCFYGQAGIDNFMQAFPLMIMAGMFTAASFMLYVRKGV